MVQNHALQISEYTEPIYQHWYRLSDHQNQT